MYPSGSSNKSRVPVHHTVRPLERSLRSSRNLLHISLLSPTEVGADSESDSAACSGEFEFIQSAFRIHRSTLARAILFGTPNSSLNRWLARRLYRGTGPS